MRKIIAAACATSLAAALSVAFAASAAASTTIVVRPGQSIQAAVNRAHPGDTVLVKPGVYHQTVQIRKDGITLRGSGNSRHGTVLKPPKSFPKTVCTKTFGPSGVCVLAKQFDAKTGTVTRPVHNDTVTGMRITGFPATGVFGFGTDGLRVTRVVAIKDGGYGIARFDSTRSVFAHNTAIGNEEAGLYVGDSPHADSVVRDNHASGNQFGIFIRHARHVLVVGNHVRGNCQGILVLDDGQKGGAGNATIRHNSVVKNNKFCPKSEEAPALKGGGILLLGATSSLVVRNHVTGNSGRQINSGGIVVASAKALTGGSNPRFDAIVHNTVLRNHPADLVWDGTGNHIKFVANHCATSVPSGLCH
jgi:nitrous oxidase accessory protein NosD